MFANLGNTVSRWWPVFLLAWAGILGLASWAAPEYQDVVLDREFAFLPETTPSRRGEKAFEKAFPSLYHPSSLVLVVHRGDRELSPEDMDFVARDLQPGLEQLRKKEAEPTIGAIHTFKEPGSGGLLVSQDKKATLVILELNSELLEHRNWSILARVDALWGRLQREGKVPAGLILAETGSAAVGADVTTRQVQSAWATEMTTVAVVIVLLMLIYRAPLIALVPLVTVFVAVQLALKFLAMLAEAKVVTVFEGLQTFITVIVYGAGVDYCLFLIARYKEELDGGTDVAQAVAHAIGKTGAAVTASAATVTLGIGMMTFARFGEFHHAGIAISSSLFISLLAVLTLTPALLRLTGRWAFWPRMVAAARPVSSEWPVVSGRQIRLDHPAAATRHSLPAESAVARLLLRLRAIATLGLSWEKLAAALHRRPGAIWLGSVVLMLPFAVVAVLNVDNLEFDLVKRLPASASSLSGIETLKEHFPPGMTGPVIVLIQKPGVDFRRKEGLALVATLTDRLNRLKKDLGIADIRSLTRPLGTSDAAQDALDELAVEMQLKKQETPAGQYQKVEDFYVGQDDVTQLQLVLSNDPLSRAAINRLEHLESAVKSNLPAELRDAQVDFLGLTAAIRDLRVVTEGDQWRIEGLVTGCVFAVLVILLRRAIVSLYLIASVLLSYLTTLGATFFLFYLLDPAGFSGLDWKVPIFLFTILVAVGEDYNIFLMTRVHEEQDKHGRVDGVLVGLVKTGRIITSCGIIMAGTFSSLLPGSLVDLKQLGFALASGVLLDTFVVRPILLPAFLVLLEGGRFRSLKKFFGLDRGADTSAATPEHALADR
jgi:RND superfamily putative drug exporter